MEGMPEHTCPVCSRPFTGRHDARYCSPACRQRAYRTRRDTGTLTGGRGHGSAQQAVLTQLGAAQQWVSVIDLASGRDDRGRVDASRYESTRRAVYTLADEGIVELAYREISERLPSVWQLLHARLA